MSSKGSPSVFSSDTVRGILIGALAGALATIIASVALSELLPWLENTRRELPSFDIENVAISSPAELTGGDMRWLRSRFLEQA